MFAHGALQSPGAQIPPAIFPRSVRPGCCRHHPQKCAQKSAAGASLPVLRVPGHRQNHFSARVRQGAQLSAPLPDGEPCNQCSSCKEIQAGTSIDILEIDGASHRGIDDIRQINETVVYASTSGKYKIYIIDEVHMLTKEAFNALLKTLEEPPAKVLFLFATTEPHKVLPTILSRCQRFNLNRIPLDKIIENCRESPRKWPSMCSLKPCR